MGKLGKGADIVCDMETRNGILDFWLELVVLLLMATGTVFVYSAGATVDQQLDLSRFYEFTTLKQLLFFPGAVLVMLVISHIDYRRLSFARGGVWRSLTPYLLGVSFLLLIYVLIWGVERNQSRRWMDIMPGPAYVSFQPSELAKWVILIFTAAWVVYYRDSLRDFKRCFVPVCAVAGAAIALIITQDFGTAAFIALLVLLVLWIGGAAWWHFAVPLAVLIPGLVLAVILSPTRVNRILDFLDPNKISYQADQSLRAISTGGLMGKGLGRGVLKYGHLPEDTTDFVFSIVAEEMGYAGALWVIVLFVLFVGLGVWIVLRCREPFGRLLAAGIVLAIGIQAAVNIGVVTVVLPTKGIPLPFVSAGGTSLVLTAAAVGVLLNIARQSAAQPDKAGPQEGM